MDYYLLERTCRYSLGDGSYWGPWLLLGGTVLIIALCALWEWRDYRRKGEDGDDDIPGRIRLVGWMIGMIGGLAGWAIVHDITINPNFVSLEACDGFFGMWSWLQWAFLPLFLLALAGNVVWMGRVTGMFWFYRLHRDTKKRKGER